MSTFSILVIVFFITSSIAAFDAGLIRAKREGVVPADEPLLPAWVGIIYWVGIGLAVAMLILDWKYAIGIFVVMFILYLLSILELVGNILMRPFKPKHKLD